jgi:hypothetical protein
VRRPTCGVGAVYVGVVSPAGVQGPLVRRCCQPHGGVVVCAADEHLLPSVELRVVSPASMEEGRKKPCVALAMESLGTLWLQRSV